MWVTRELPEMIASEHAEVGHSFASIRRSRRRNGAGESGRGGDTNGYAHDDSIFAPLGRVITLKAAPMSQPSADPKPPGDSRVPAWIRGFRGPWSPRDLLLLCSCPLIGVFAAYASERFQLQGHVLPGISVDGTDVSGYSAAALESTLRARELGVGKRVVRVRVGAAVFRVSGADLGARLRSEVSGEVMRAGRTGNILAQMAWRVGRLSTFDEHRARFDLDQALVEEHLRSFEKAALPTPTEGNVRYLDGKVVAVYPSPGETIDRRVAPQILEDAVNDGVAEVNMPAIRWSPSTSKSAVDAAKRRFESAVERPVEMFVRFPAAEVAQGQTDGETEDEQQARVEVLAPAMYAPALTTRQAPGKTEELELTFDVPLLEQGLVDVKKRWERPAQNAQFVPDHRNRLSILPSKSQWVLPTDSAASALLQALATPARRGVWELVTGVQPRITTELAHQLNITQLVAKFTTFHPCCKPRVENIHRIADLIDGTVILPGETFSVNETLGPRTATNGFTMAPTIVKGEMDDTVGGGISQFATTLFNAVLRGGYEIIERQPHSIYFSRYPMGHEATLSYPKPDLIFKNDTPSGMVIKTSYTGTSIRVMIFGDNNGRIVSTDVSKPFDSVEPTVEYIPDPALPTDEEKVEEKGDWGFTVYASRTVKEKDGTERTESRKVVYKPRARRLVVHPCKIPEGFEGHTGEECPEPEEGAPDAG